MRGVKPVSVIRKDNSMFWIYLDNKWVKASIKKVVDVTKGANDLIFIGEKCIPDKAIKYDNYFGKVSGKEPTKALVVKNKSKFWKFIKIIFLLAAYFYILVFFGPVVFVGMLCGMLIGNLLHKHLIKPYID